MSTAHCSFTKSVCLRRDCAGAACEALRVRTAGVAALKVAERLLTAATPEADRVALASARATLFPVDEGQTSKCARAPQFMTRTRQRERGGG